MNTPTSGSNEPPKRARVRVRAWHIVLLIAAVVCTLFLAWWQWTRFKSGSGTLQNLGYAMQWPFFGAFFVYAYRMGIKMENEKIDALNAGASLEDLYAADMSRFGGDKEPTTIDEAFLPARPELGVEEFNALNVQRRGSARSRDDAPDSDPTAPTTSPSPKDTP